MQMNHLSTHPQVAARLATGEIKIFGWYYDIRTGAVLQYNQSSGRFEPLNDEAHAAAPLPIRSFDASV